MKLVVDALLIIYLFYPGSKLILMDIGKPFRSSTCLMQYSWSLSGCAFPAGRYQLRCTSLRIATETRPARNTLSHSCIWSFDPITDSLSKTGGAFTFALSLCVWYLLLVQMFEAIDFPINLPVGDLRAIIPGR